MLKVHCSTIWVIFGSEKLNFDLFLASIDYTRFFQSSKNQAIRSLQIDSLQVISFYERSEVPFHPTLMHLEEIVEDMVTSKENIEIVMSISFTQEISTTTSKFTQIIKLEDEEKQKLTYMLELLRNLNGEGNRATELEQKSLYFKFDIYPVTKNPKMRKN